MFLACYYRCAKRYIKSQAYTSGDLQTELESVVTLTVHTANPSIHRATVRPPQKHFEVK